MKNKNLYIAGALLAVAIIAFTFARPKDTALERAPELAQTLVQESALSLPEVAPANKNTIAESAAVPTTPPEVSDESLRLTAGDISISLPATGGSLLDILQTAKARGEILFDGKDYPSLGFFMTEIGPLKGGADKHLVYSINGKEASVGVSLYVPEDGDVVEWELK